MQDLYLFEKSGAVVRIIPDTLCTLKDFGTCMSVRKVPEVQGQAEMFVPMTALRKLSNEEKEEFILKQVNKAMGLSPAPGF
jgi:hypothetical protein